MRILAVDPGEKNIGLAISDPTGSIASPLGVIKHISRPVDAAAIVQLAGDHEAERIIVGMALDDEGELSLEGRKAVRLAEVIRSQTEIPVEMWDESGSTAAARAARIQMGARRKKRTGHLDEIAATVILQTYLDAHNPPVLPGFGDES